jgi:hypothetical protein
MRDEERNTRPDECAAVGCRSKVSAVGDLEPGASDTVASRKED